MRPLLRYLLPLIALAILAGCTGPRDAVEKEGASARPVAGDGFPRLNLEDIFARGTFSSRGFAGGRWAAEGPVVTFIERDGDATHLVSYNLETDARERVIDGSRLYAADVDRLIAIEDYQFAEQGSRVLLYTDSERVWRQNTKGYYYVYEPASGTLTPVGQRDRGFQMFAKLSPDGGRVAFVRNRDLFMVDLATGEEVRLTDSGSEGGIINGTTDWVYEEEFGLRDAWAWSPDGRYLAFLQLDESNTRDFVMADLRGHYPELTRFRYPKAGESNSEVHVGVVDTDTRDVRFFPTGTWFAGRDSLEYIPQLGWTPVLGGTHHVWMFRMNRDQNDLDLLYGHPETMAVRTVLEEKAATWLDVETGFSDLDVGNLTYLDDGRHFVWISERDGYRHLYLYENDGSFVRRLTAGAWDVTDFHGVDEAGGLLYFTATKESPLERHLYRQPFGEGQEAGGQGARRVTVRPGWHAVNMSVDRRYYIDTFSDAVTPPVISLHRADGAEVNVFEDNAALRERLAAYGLTAPEFIEVPGADGTPLNVYLIKPRSFDGSKKYPLLVHLYGGPGSQEVRRAWYRPDRRLWHHYLAEELGLVVAVIDARGTGGRGNAFKSGTYRQLGVLEAQDQIAAARHLSGLSYVDPGRTGIWGWSYGGYMTLMAMLYGDGPQTFEVGVAVAPVTDWRQYDTIYTERFMSTPQRNPEGYRVSAPITYADRLRDDQDLLLVHGELDDNVHLQNAVQMVDALQDADKQFELMYYPGRDHGIGGGRRLHLFRLMTNFLAEHLAGDAR